MKLPKENAKKKSGKQLLRISTSDNYMVENLNFLNEKIQKLQMKKNMVPDKLASLSPKTPVLLEDLRSSLKPRENQPRPADSSQSIPGRNLGLVSSVLVASTGSADSQQAPGRPSSSSTNPRVNPLNMLNDEDPSSFCPGDSIFSPLMTPSGPSGFKPDIPGPTVDYFKKASMEEILQYNDKSMSKTPIAIMTDSDYNILKQRMGSSRNTPSSAQDQTVSQSIFESKYPLSRVFRESSLSNTLLSKCMTLNNLGLSSEQSQPQISSLARDSPVNMGGAHNPANILADVKNLSDLNDLSSPKLVLGGSSQTTPKATQPPVVPLLTGIADILRERRQGPNPPSSKGPRKVEDTELKDQLRESFYSPRDSKKKYVPGLSSNKQKSKAENILYENQKQEIWKSVRNKRHFSPVVQTCKEQFGKWAFDRLKEKQKDSNLANNVQGPSKKQKAISQAKILRKDPGFTGNPVSSGLSKKLAGQQSIANTLKLSASTAPQSSFKNSVLPNECKPS